MLLGIGNCKVQNWVGVVFVSGPNVTLFLSSLFHVVFCVAMLAHSDGPALKVDDTLLPGISWKESVLASFAQSE